MGVTPHALSATCPESRLTVAAEDESVVGSSFTTRTMRVPTNERERGTALHTLLLSGVL